MNFFISSLHKYKDKYVGKIEMMSGHSGEGETKLDLSICTSIVFNLKLSLLGFFFNKKGNADFRTCGIVEWNKYHSRPAREALRSI